VDRKNKTLLVMLSDWSQAPVVNPFGAEFVQEDQQLSETPLPIDMMAWVDVHGSGLPAPKGRIH
jgi:hypothetical protein